MRSRFRAVAAALTVATLLVAACGGDDDDASSDGASGAATAADGEATGLEPQPLDEETAVTIVPAVAIESFAPVFLADALGEFEAENLDVTITLLPPSDGYVAVARGDAEVQVGGVNAAFLNAVNAGTELRWVANVYQSGGESRDGLWVRNELLNEDGEVDADTIRDMNIAIGAGGITSTSALPVAEWAAEQGVELSELQLQPLGGNDIAVALEAGSIGAGYVLPPAWVTIEQSGCCTLVTPPPAPAGSTYTMSEAFIEDQPEVAAAIMRALARTVDTYLQGDYHADDEVMAAMAEAFGVPVEGISQTPPLVFDPDLGLDVDQIEELQDLWIANDVLEYDEPIPLDRLVDRSPAEAVVGTS